MPYRYGRVVGGSYVGSDRLVVYIQDLHCHSEVQKNIYEIIKMLDSKYNVAKIFAEGAPKGKVDTTLLSSIPDEIRDKTLDNLLSKGLISGAEYYVVKEKKDKLYGLEDWGTYLENLSRIRNILANKDKYYKIANNINNQIFVLKKRYLSKELKQLEKFFDKKLQQKSTSKTNERYYLELEKLAYKYGIGLTNYPNLNRYIQMVRINRESNYKKLSIEIQNYFKELQNIVPFGVYSSLLDLLKDQKRIEEYYLSLAEVSKQYTPDMVRKYPNLARFFEYIRLNYSINPINLTLEEKSFSKDVLRKYPKKMLDREILFLSEMMQYLKSFLELKITQEEFDYFSKNTEQFKLLLNKYLSDYEVKEITKFIDDKEIYSFYKTNIFRDKIFYEAICANVQLVGNRKSIGDNNYGEVLNKIQDFKEVVIVVAGGFHLDISDLVNMSGSSSLTIVPNVTKKYDIDIYEKVLTGNINWEDFTKSAFANALLSVAGETETKILTISIMNILDDKNVRSADLLQKIKDTIDKWSEKNRDVSTVGVSNNSIEVKVKDKIFKVGVIVENGKNKLQVEEVGGNVSSLPGTEVKNLSLRNRVIMSVTTGLVTAITAGLSTVFISPFLGIGVGILGLIAFSYYFNIMVWMMRARSATDFYFGLIEEFENLPEEQKDLTDRVILARTINGKIHINPTMISKLPYRIQRYILRHEQLHQKFDERNIRLPNVVEEFLISISELIFLRINFKREIYRVQIESIVKNLPRKVNSARWSNDAPSNFNELLMYCRDGIHPSPLRKMLQLVDSNYDLFSGYVRLCNEFLPVRKRLLARLKEPEGNVEDILVSELGISGYSNFIQFTYFVPENQEDIDKMRTLLSKLIKLEEELKVISENNKFSDESRRNNLQSSLANLFAGRSKWIDTPWRVLWA
ncbi:MAG: hypothetical protein SNJ64_06485, partial [Endomicrobiia bacterium]